MKAVKILAGVLAAYVAMVAAFETYLGTFQPRPASTIVITTTDESGTSQDRVVSPLQSMGKLYVSANHWPRSWYERALKNPHVHVTMDGQKKPYVAVPVTGEEHERLAVEHAHPIAFRILTGFPPRYFLRLDPR